MSGLYIHIPFCDKKCPYCSFYTHLGTPTEMSDLVSAIEIELGRLTGETRADYIDTVFIGGGTPTALDPESLTRLFEALNPILEWSIENTCEANPESVSLEKLKMFRNGGVNRLSLGVQSFSDRLLKELGRLHDSRKAMEALDEARQAEFDNLSLDLMFGLPGQSIHDWESDLEQAIEIAPEHISFYGLSIDKGTQFAGRFKKGSDSEGLPPEEQCREMYYLGIDLLKGAGYEHYEISNFSKPGFEAWHNLNYWRHGTYLAIGPSAAGFDGARRWKFLPDTKRYIEAVTSGGNPIAEEETLTASQLISESIMLGLRLLEGIDLGYLSSRFGEDIKSLYEPQITSMRELGMVDLNGDVLRLQRDALFVSDSIIDEFMLTESKL